MVEVNIYLKNPYELQVGAGGKLCGDVICNNYSTCISISSEKMTCIETGNLHFPHNFVLKKQCQKKNLVDATSDNLKNLFS